MRVCTTPKAPFIVTQLNSTGRPVELSCVAINGVYDFGAATLWMVAAERCAEHD